MIFHDTPSSKYLRKGNLNTWISRLFIFKHGIIQVIAISCHLCCSWVDSPKDCRLIYLGHCLKPSRCLALLLRSFLCGRPAQPTNSISSVVTTLWIFRSQLTRILSLADRHLLDLCGFGSMPRECCKAWLSYSQEKVDEWVDMM